MPAWKAYPSAITTGVNSAGRTLVDPPESIGSPGDAAATDVTVENSAFALLKGICRELGIPTGSGDGDVNTSPKLYRDPLATLGEMSDAAATDVEHASAISLLKGIAAVGL